MTAPVVFLQLNEINFDFVAHYVRKFDDLPAFKRLIAAFQPLATLGENSYEQLEPWIQWVSAQTGKTFAEHGVFRLGDVVKAPDDLTQIFETLEQHGLRVGAVSPMNARNRLRNPAYFIPDPWTDTPPHDSGFARRLTQMLRQTVNENARGRIAVRSALALAEAVLMSFSPVRTWRLLQTIAHVRAKPWTKSLVLDQLLHLVHMKLWQKTSPDASFVFLNAGAHIQHHYMFNADPVKGKAANPAWYVPAEADPVYDMLKVYDSILADYLTLQESGVRLLVATGLTQVPYDRVKFYYRLKDHAQFLKSLGMSVSRVLPRMTRDFEVQFASEQDASSAASKLRGAKMKRDGRLLFGEIDLKGQTLFASLTYPDEIQAGDAALFEDGQCLEDFAHHVAFVAIKNGMHSQRGFAFLSPNTPPHPYQGEPVHVSKLFDVTIAASLQDSKSA